MYFFEWLMYDGRTKNDYEVLIKEDKNTDDEKNLPFGQHTQFQKKLRTTNLYMTTTAHI